jgi:D-amino-acid dehydrogenase
LSADEVIEKEPSLTAIAGKLTGGIHFSEDENGNPLLFCQALAKAAKNAGVKFEYGQTVNKLSKTGNGVRIKTGDGDIETDAIVLAAGSYTPKLARQLGVYVPVKPAKGYSISIPLNDWQPRPSHTIGDMNLHAGLNALGNTLRVAGTGEFTGFDTSISSNRIQSLFRLIEQILPDFAVNMEREKVDPWCGLRPLSADGLPIIGDSGVEGVYLNTGHGGLGFSQSAGSGKALADHIAGKSDRFDLTPFSINRF